MFLQPDGDVFLSIVSTKYSWKFPPPKKDDSNDDDDIDDDNDNDNDMDPRTKVSGEQS